MAWLFQQPLATSGRQVSCTSLIPEQQRLNNSLKLRSQAWHQHPQTLETVLDTFLFRMPRGCHYYNMLFPCSQYAHTMKKLRSCIPPAVLCLEVYL